MQVIDIVKPTPRTGLGKYLRWRNRIASELRSMPGYGRKIEVIDQAAADFWGGVHGDSKADAEHARREDEAIQDEPCL